MAYADDDKDHPWLEEQWRIGRDTVFDKMLGKSKPAKYPAIFVVPEDKATRYQAQKFAGPPGGTPKKTDQPVNVESRFELWVMGI
jgi:hypothetical protein